jgi:ribonuclease BN (tRNA processing enzyme)
LAEAGYTYRDIDAVYISHQHADHIGGLEWLAFMTYFDPMCEKIPLYLSQDIDLWEDFLQESLRYLVGETVERGAYFDWNDMVIPIHDETPPDLFHLGHLTFEAVPVWHVVGEIKEVGFCMRSFGLRISGPEEPNVFWTSDTTFDPDHLMEHYEWADWILHDCETSLANEGKPVNRHATRSNVHPHFYDLAELPLEIKKKMFLIHYQDNVLDERGRVISEWAARARGGGFARFVEKGEELVLTL